MAPLVGAAAARCAVIDLGSNSFRLVVYAADRSATDLPGGAWWRAGEIYEPARIGADLGADGALQPASIERALIATELFDHYCRAHGLTGDLVSAVATSAIREAPNQAAFLDRVRATTGLEPQVLSQAAEAHYGHLAAINSTTLRDGGVLDIGGGSMQLVRTADRRATDVGSWRLGAVRMTERFLAGSGPTSDGQQQALRKHVRKVLGERDWTTGIGDRLVGVGGAVRNLAAAVQHRHGSTDLGVQAVRVRRATLGSLIDELAALPVAERRAVDGIKPSRGDVILAAAITIDAVLEHTGVDAIEATEFGLRDGIFLERQLSDLERQDGLAAYPDVRGAAVENLAARYDDDRPHRRHVTRLALEVYDQLGACGAHPADPRERSLLEAAATLHDIGTAVNHDDHHKHGRYLVVTNGLPGFSPPETALIGQAIRYHRKGSPTMKPFRALARDGDDERLLRLAAALRLAEGLDRGHDQAVRAVEVARDGDDVRLRLNTGPAGDPVARWAAQGQAALVERAFGVRLTVTDGAA
ncbi:MAG: Ppx/GppA family phosphatase [Patulibacter sp.]|nr:Ppx/GppA family phosphatase [Patulibacter sp.]